ncbi:hypothetical protein PY370_02040 [Lactiplantibacillus plantarum]|uniref:hypothetical protein n=1 Tax=Lactiplantibacillus plantarum TaxID=1590 RepID=UPI000E66A011|nr:hypothetical protein [Lactiplantibacillus plantarum]MDN7047339.1 hypothetical protein [Lactiplantibacillus plantarum]
MIIKINNGYQVEAQKYNNWALQRVTDSKGGRLTDKLGKPTPKTIGYYPDLSLALKAFYTQRLIDDNEVLKIDEYLILLDKTNRELSKKLDSLNVGGDDDESLS